MEIKDIRLEEHSSTYVVLRPPAGSNVSTEYVRRRPVFLLEGRLRRRLVRMVRKDARKKRMLDRTAEVIRHRKEDA